MVQPGDETGDEVPSSPDLPVPTNEQQAGNGSVQDLTSQAQGLSLNVVPILVSAVSQEESSSRNDAQEMVIPSEPPPLQPQVTENVSGMAIV